MKKILLLVTTTCFTVVLSAQEKQNLADDQNPNYKLAMEKYVANLQEYTSLQGTTVQETYKAIDPLEEKRELKALRRQYRAQRPYWRHQRRLEQAKNTRYIYDNNNWGNNWGYNNFPYAPFGRRYGRFSRFNRFDRGLGWFGLGLSASCLF